MLYVLGLQEASVIAMADGFAQAARGPSLVNLHTSPGLGNAMGNLGTAFQNKTPLIVTSGQGHQAPRHPGHLLRQPADLGVAWRTHHRDPRDRESHAGDLSV